MNELEKYQEQNKAQTLQIIQLLQEIEQLKAYRAITDQAIASSYGKLRRNWVNGAIKDLKGCGDAVKKLEGEG
jgi:hypothetical protein